MSAVPINTGKLIKKAKEKRLLKGLKRKRIYITAINSAELNKPGNFVDSIPFNRLYYVTYPIYTTGSMQETNILEEKEYTFLNYRPNIPFKLELAWYLFTLWVSKINFYI
jgi:hypothetical protein